MNVATIFAGIGGATEAARAAETVDQLLHASPDEERPRHLGFIQPNMVEIEGLDSGIADAVHLLRRYDIPTFASCEGGEGHLFAHPTIRIYTLRVYRYRTPVPVQPTTIAQILTSAGYSGFYIKRVDCYQSTAEPWHPEAMSFIEVEFWADKDHLLPEAA